jgi:hypothetical protein
MAADQVLLTDAIIWRLHPISTGFPRVLPCHCRCVVIAGGLTGKEA